MDTAYTILLLIGLSLLAGLAMPVGAYIAHITADNNRWFNSELKHGIIAFGGGALLCAVALILVPQGIAHQTTTMSVIYFSGGGIAFMAIDIILDKVHAPAGQLVAMLSDFIPEALALGAAIAFDSSAAMLIAILMLLQNLPEGFNAYHELTNTSKFSGNKILKLFALLSLFGPLAGVAGFIWLIDKPDAVSAVMLFAAGGILYSVFQDIAPQAKLEKHWLPALGAIIGFALGMVGHMML